MQALTMGMHHKTPGLSVVDPRGLSIRSVDYWREVEGDPAQARINRTFHDAAGRAVGQWDPRLWALKQEEPLTPANLTTVFSLSGNALFTDSVDAGWQLTLSGLGNEVLLGWDSRDTRRKIEYDDLLRPVSVFEQGGTEPSRCVERMEYGDPDHGDQNQCGQLIRHDDSAGTVLFEAFSITGQCVKQVRHFTLDPVAPDWPQLGVDRQRLLEPGEGAASTWSFGPLNDVLEQVDAKGNRQAFSLTLDGRLRETRLQLQGLSTWQTLVSDIQYNAEGQVTHETAGNHVQTTLVYRAEDGVLMERRAQDASARLLQHLIYNYDWMGNVLSIEDKAMPVRYFANQRIDPVSRFIYDSLSQLIEAFGWEAGGPNQGPESVGRADPAAVSNYHQTYSYDESGNLLKLTHVGAQSLGRELKAARYSNRCLPWRNGVPPTEEAIAAAFDARGNLLELDQGRFLRWNLRNQLQSVSPVARESGLNDREFYIYDGGGQRVRKIRSLQTNARTVGAEVRYLPGLELRTDDGTAKRLQVITAQTGLNSVRVLHWETEPPHGMRNDQYRYGLVDHLSSCTLELASDARIISRETYYPFGESAWSAGPNDTDGDYKTIRYSGKERDATGLYYFGFRYYAAQWQRWLNPDPAGAIDGLGLYSMVGNNPMSYRDADGLELLPTKLANLIGSASFKTLEIEINTFNMFFFKSQLPKKKVKTLDATSGLYESSDDFDVVEIGVGTREDQRQRKEAGVMDTDELKDVLRDYGQKYADLAKSPIVKKAEDATKQGWNFKAGAYISEHMLDAVNLNGIMRVLDLMSGKKPDTRLFALMKKSDRDKEPAERKIYGVTMMTLAFPLENDEAELTVDFTVIDPGSQLSGEQLHRAIGQQSLTQDTLSLRGAGTFLTMNALNQVSETVNLKKIKTQAINPRSQMMALGWGDQRPL
jgi:insecticidal toxin complex protein TccC